LRNSTTTQPMAPIGYKWALVKIESDHQER